jgi:hypothetical protein
MHMQPLNSAVAEEMRKRAKGVADRMNSGNFTKSWSFTGKNAIVEAGKAVTGRLLPRWDYINSVVLDPTTNKRVPNPTYDFTKVAFVVALEHWWESDGKWSHEWCPRMYDAAAACAVCISAAELMRSGAKEDRDWGKKLLSKEVFIFNAVVGDPRKVGQDGLVDIRILSCTGTVYKAISDLMTGGDNEKFALGDVCNPREGYDLSFKRPVKDGGDRWSVQAAPQASPLYGPPQADAFKGWATRLIDLEAMLEAETKDVAGIFQAFYGRAPGPGEIEGSAGEPDPVKVQIGNRVAPAGPASDFDIGAEVEQQSADAPTDPDDAFIMPPSSSPQARSAVSAPGPAARPRAASRPPRR